MRYLAKNFGSVLIGTAVILASASIPVNAQQTRVSVLGRVFDQASNAPIANATVRFTGPETDVTTSGANGGFSLTVAQGPYRVVATAPGYSTVTEISVQAINQPLNVQVAMARVSLRTISHITVTTEAQPFNVTPAAIDRVTAQEIREQGQIGIARIRAQIPGVSVAPGVPIGANALSGTMAVNSPIVPVAVSIRGAQPYQSATLYDGHRLESSPQFGAPEGPYNFAYLDPYSFASLDVLKGPGASAPNINNAIGGVINIEPGIPSGPPSFNFSTGTDGLGGLNTNFSISGSSQNKRVGLGIVASSITSPGVLFNSVGFTAPPQFGGWTTLNGQSFSCTPPSGSSNPKCVTTVSLLPPNLYGFGPNKTITQALVCCTTSSVPDFHNMQRRNFNFRYDIAPTVELRLRYGINNSAANYVNAPLPVVFQAPSGYTGSIKSGTQVLSAPYTYPFNFFDQLFEYDVRARVGVGSFRYSYATYQSTGIFNLNTNESACACTYDGLAYLAGNPTVFNGQTVQLGATVSPETGYYSRFTHDFVGEITYPIGRSTIALSYNTTKEREGLQIQTPSFTSTGFAGEYMKYNTYRLRVDNNIGEHIRTTTSIFVNGYHYHVVDPTDPAGKRFTDTFLAYTAPRFGVEWLPTPDIAVRASTGAGISPIDFDEFAGTNVGPFPEPFGGPPQYYFSVVNNPALKPETSWGEDLGISRRLRDHSTSISLDIYHTLLHNQFYFVEAPNGTYLGLPLISAETGNLGQSRYYGIEFAYSHAPQTGLFYKVSGSLQRAYTYNLPKGFYDSPFTGPNSLNLTIIPNVNFGGGQGPAVVPYAQGFGSVGWRTAKGAFVALNATFWGKNNGFYRPPFIVMDMDAGVPVGKIGTLNLVFSNVTNVYPSLSYDQSQFTVLPYVFPDPQGHIGQAQAVGNVGPRLLTLTMNFHVGGKPRSDSSIP